MLINIIYLISFTLISGDVLNASEDIECVPLENCPFALNLLSKTQKIINVINFLNSTKCGEVEGTRKMKVWCNKFINCKTYDKRNGTCLPQENCFELNASLSNEKKYFCNIIGKAEQNHVCCPWSYSSYSHLIPLELNLLDGNEKTKVQREIFQMESEEQSTENPETLENHEEELNAKCVTPHNTSGLCTDIEKCPSFLEKTKVANISDISVLMHNLRKYQCEYINNQANSKIIKVCCPSSSSELDAKIRLSTSLQDRIFPSEEKQINNCGRQNIDNKITQGSATSLAEFPWTALFQYESSRENGKYYFGCAGTIINKKWIITAAHCVNADMMELNNFKKLHKIILGEYDTRNETDCFNSSFGTECADPIQYFNPKRIIEHEDFQTLQPARDIALIELDEEIKFSDYIKPICLPSGSKKAFRLIRNESIFISGWGRTELGESSPIKQKAKIVYLGEDNCNRSLGLNEGQLCLESQNGIDSCKGDSGGPLMHISADKKSGDLIATLVGIISFGIGKCGTNYSVNTYIPYYLDWIANNMT